MNQSVASGGKTGEVIKQGRQTGLCVSGIGQPTHRVNAQWWLEFPATAWMTVFSSRC